MFRLSKQQIEELNETAEARIKRKVAEQVLFSDPDWANEELALKALLDQLFESDFQTYGHLKRAALGVIAVARRDDSTAAEARALTDAILFNRNHAPAARLDFFEGQELEKPRESETV